VTTIQVRQAADENERYVPGCFDSSVGKHIPFKLGDHPVPGATCKLIAAEVADDGSEVLLTLEVESQVLTDAIEVEQHASFGFADETLRPRGW
jgi:hypothetical protein